MDWADRALAESDLPGMIDDRVETGDEPWTLDEVATWVRAAYGRGYCDALKGTVPPPPVNPERAVLELTVRLPVR